MNLKALLEAVLILIVVAFCVLAGFRPKRTETDSFDETVVETEEAVKQAKFEATEGDGMPCMQYVAPIEAPIVVSVDTTETVIAPIDEPTEAEKPIIPLYTVNGAMLPEELQTFTYYTLQHFDMEWLYPTFLCQIYQESRFDQAAVSANGSYGLCQINIAWHSQLKELAGIPEADLIADPYANIYIGAFLMNMYYQQCGDLNTAISAYNTGFVDKYNPDYVQQVRQWESTLKDVNQN